METQVFGGSVYLDGFKLGEMSFRNVKIVNQ